MPVLPLPAFWLKHSGMPVCSNYTKNFRCMDGIKIKAMEPWNTGKQLKNTGYVNTIARVTVFYRGRVKLILVNPHTPILPPLP